MSDLTNPTSGIDESGRPGLSKSADQGPEHPDARPSTQAPKSTAGPAAAGEPNASFGAAPQVDESNSGVLVKGLETAQQTREQLTSMMSEHAEAATELIRAKPLASAAAVFGAGVLMGMLLNRPRN